MLTTLSQDACSYLGITADQLDEAWGPAKKVKFGGGFYCGLVSIKGKKPIYGGCVVSTTFNLVY